MSTLSKIFVVLTLLLSIGYCVAAAFLFAYSQDYKAQYEKEQDLRKEDSQKSEVEISGLKSDVTALTSQSDALEKDNDKLKRDNTEVHADLKESQRAFIDMDQAYKTLNTAHVATVRIADDLKNSLEAEQEKVERLKKQIAEATDKNEGLTNEIAVLKDDKDKIDKKLLATRKELHKNEEMRNEYESILAKLEASGIDVGVVVVNGGDPVHGQVLAVDSETDIVVISIGDDAGVVKGMKLSVYREDNFVGSLSVISVYPDMSSARILRELTQKEVQPGDNVTNQF